MHGSDDARVHRLRNVCVVRSWCSGYAIYGRVVVVCYMYLYVFTTLWASTGAVFGRRQTGNYGWQRRDADHEDQTNEQ